MSKRPATVDSYRIIDIVHVDDERVDYFLDGKDLVSVNHDEDGWGGMETVDKIVRRMAMEAGWTVREDYGGSSEED